MVFSRCAARRVEDLDDVGVAVHDPERLAVAHRRHPVRVARARLREHELRRGHVGLAGAVARQRKAIHVESVQQRDGADPVPETFTGLPPELTNIDVPSCVPPHPFPFTVATSYSPTMRIGVCRASMTNMPPPRSVTNVYALFWSMIGQIGQLSGRTPAASQGAPLGVVHVARSSVAAALCTKVFVS